MNISKGLHTVIVKFHLLSIMKAGKVDYPSVSDEEWKKKLSTEQFYITRQKGTERAFTGYDS